MKDISPEFDEVGKWTEIKLEIIRKYATAYCTILRNQGRFNFYYIDAFSGQGYHLTKDAHERIKGSPIIVLENAPDCDEYHFIELDSAKGDQLKRECKEKYPNKKVRVYSGKDCNEVLLELFPKIVYAQYKRALCLLDPYGLHLSWEVIKQAGEMGTIELLLNFPVMDMQQNVLWHNPEKVASANKERMNKFWGDSSWEQASYRKNPQGDLFGGESKIKESTLIVAKAYQKRLKDEAGFKFVSEPLPMRNSKNSIVYYLIFMSPNKTAHKIMRDIFSRHQNQ